MERPEDLEREAEDMERRGEKLDRRIKEASSDWQSKKEAQDAPGAQDEEAGAVGRGDPEQAEDVAEPEDEERDPPTEGVPGRPGGGP